MEAEVPVTDRVLLARYRLGDLLGRGGMAEVYDGYDERLHRPVAVKLLRPDMAVDPDVRSRFEVEARSAARLHHPNVVGVFDTGEDSGTPFIVMERLPGETLADRIAAEPVNEAWLRRVAVDVLDALGAAHAAGLIHRDVKPGNILIAENGCAKVADFGIAKSVEVAGDLTGTGLLVGTPAYLAPERLDGRPATEQSDLYSLGVVLYEALAGVKPFVGTSSVETANAVMNEDPRPLRELRPDVDPRFAAAVERAMAKVPASRPASAGEMARDLGDSPAEVAADSTVAIASGVSTGDPTVVGAPAPVARPATDGDLPESVGGGGWRRAATHGGLVGARRLTPRQVGVMVAGALVLVLLLIALAAKGGIGGGPGPGGLVAAIRELAGRVETGDGVKGPEASERLEKIADQVEAGGGADEANSLLRDARQWSEQGQLSAPAATEMASVLGRVDGVEPSLVTTVTSSTPATTAPSTSQAPPPPDNQDEEEKDKGKGKGRDD